MIVTIKLLYAYIITTVFYTTTTWYSTFYARGLPCRDTSWREGAEKWFSFPCWLYSQALILSKMTYALPAFAGLISVTVKSEINKFFLKAHRHRLVTTVFDIQSLIDKHNSTFSVLLRRLYWSLSTLPAPRKIQSFNESETQRTRIHT